MKFKCAKCKKHILTRDRRKKQELSPAPGASLIQSDKLAPSVRCSCGLVTIFMKGEY